MKIFLIISAIIVVGLVVFYFVYEKKILPGYSNSDVKQALTATNPTDLQIKIRQQVQNLKRG